MFDCGPPIPGEFRCRFTSNEMFTSGALEVNRHEFEDSQYQNRESHASELTNLLGGDFPDSGVQNPVKQNPEPPPRVEEPAKSPGRTMNLFIDLFCLCLVKKSKKNISMKMYNS